MDGPKLALDDNDKDLLQAIEESKRTHAEEQRRRRSTIDDAPLRRLIAANNRVRCVYARI